MGIRSIIVETILEDKINQICIKDVLHVFKLYANLLSVNKLALNGLEVQFNLNEWFVKSCHGEAITIAPYERNL